VGRGGKATELFSSIGNRRNSPNEGLNERHRGVGDDGETEEEAAISNQSHGRKRSPAIRASHRVGKKGVIRREKIGRTSGLLQSFRDRRKGNSYWDGERTRKRRAPSVTEDAHPFRTQRISCRGWLYTTTYTATRYKRLKSI